MMPFCGYKRFLGRCRRVATVNIGKIALIGESDGYGKPWEQTHYLCHKHQLKLLRTLGFGVGSEK